jgi:hypothetical protein
VGNNFMNSSNYARNLAGLVGGAFNLNRYYLVGYGSKPIADMNAVPNSSFIRRTLAQSRAAHPNEIKDLAAGITDARFYRITVELGNIGIHLAR